MSLRTKSALIVGSVILVLCFALFLLGSVVLLGNIYDGECERARRNVSQVVYAIGEELEALQREARDYGEWDDTFLFVQNRSPKFLERNFYRGNYLELHLNVVIILDEASITLYSDAIDLTSDQKHTGRDRELLKALMDVGVIKEKRCVTSTFGGIVMVGKRPSLVAIQPILTSTAEGPSRGALIMARELDRKNLDRIGAITRSRFDLVPAEPHSVPSAYLEQISSLPREGKVTVNRQGNHYLIAESILADVVNRPAARLRLRYSSRFSAQAKAAMLYLLGALLFLGVTAAAATAHLIDRSVVRPIAHIVPDVNTISATGKTDTRVRATASAEIGDLATRINAMLDAIGQAHRRLRESDARYAAVAAAASDSILVVEESSGGIIDVNSAATALLGYTRDELLTMTLDQVLLPPPDSPDPVTVLAQGGVRTWVGDRQYHCKRGFIGDAEVGVAPLSFADRRARCVLIHDITYRKRNEKRLRQETAERMAAEQRLRRLSLELEDRVRERTTELERTNAELRETERMLQQSATQLRRLTDHLQTSLEEERNRIAREVHDNLGLEMTVLKMDLAWIHRRLSEGHAGEFQRSLTDKVAQMAQFVDTLIASVQEITAQLRPAVLDHGGLAAAVEWQASEFAKRTGLEIQTELTQEDLPVPQEQSVAVFRVFQETLTNVVRHSEATSAVVRLEVSEDSLVHRCRVQFRHQCSRQLRDGQRHFPDVVGDV